MPSGWCPPLLFNPRWESAHVHKTCLKINQLLFNHGCGHIVFCSLVAVNIHLDHLR
jgi:hypothetical protein